MAVQKTPTKMPPQEEQAAGTEEESSPSTDSTDVDVEAGEQVVNVDGLMSYVNEMLDGGRQLFEARDFKTAMQVYQQGLDAIAQCEGLPMHVDDVPRVVMAKSLVHSFRSELLMEQELYRRALKESESAVTSDPNNGSAFLYQALARQRVKAWDKGLEDVLWLLRPEMLHRNRSQFTEFFRSKIAPVAELTEQLVELGHTPTGSKSTASGEDAANKDAETSKGAAKNGNSSTTSAATSTDTSGAHAATSTAASTSVGGANSGSTGAEASAEGSASSSSTDAGQERRKKKEDAEKKLELQHGERDIVGNFLRSRHAGSVPEQDEATADAENAAILKVWGSFFMAKQTAYDAAFEERVEDAQFQGLKEMKERFEDVVQRNGLKQNEALASELAEYIQKQGGKVSAQKVADIYSLDIDDAHVMLEWIQTQTRIQSVLGQAV
ncbi:unnamed protein product [Amoebophrya sp. A25]|nr:unnamed protein product [Amoebophrya sp. A25]|eukprot:GSA25T00015783001.1